MTTNNHTEPCHHSHHAHAGSQSWLAARATLHCLTGCVIGEVAGLMIGISLGLHPYATMALATGLAYVSGFSLGLLPVMREQNKSFVEAFKLIWLGEAVSIGVMEIAMNATDYWVGGMNAASVFHLSFWIGLGAAIPAGFLAAWPVNAWLLSRDLKNCH